MFVSRVYVDEPRYILYKVRYYVEIIEYFIHRIRNLINRNGHWVTDFYAIYKGVLTLFFFYLCDIQVCDYGC